MKVFYFAIIVLIAFSFGVSAQDLSRESLPPEFIETTRLKGNGAILSSCDLVKGYILRCQSDRPLRRVECLPHFILDPSRNEKGGPSQELLPQKMGTRAFACAVSRKDNPVLNSTVKVFILSDDGNLSHYLIRFGSQNEVEKTYAREFNYVTFQKPSLMSRPTLTPFFQSFSANESYSRWGLKAQALLSSQLSAGIEWSRALSNSERWGQDFSIGLNHRLFSAPLVDGGFWLDFSQRLAENIEAFRVELNASQNLGLSFLHMKSHLKFQYPRVPRHRQAYEMGGGLTVGPFFKKSLSFDAGVAYKNQLWTQKSSQEWKESGLQIMASMSLVFDGDRDAP